MHSIDRRRFLTATSACGLGLAAIPLLPGRAWSQMTDSDGMGGTLMTPATRAAIDRGLSFLARQQSSDGSFRGGAYNRNAAIVSLAGMAFMSCGSTPGRGPYGVEVRRCVDFIMSLAKPSGFIVSPAASQSHGPMYEHGFATMFLAEAYGMSLRTDIREALVKAVRRIRDTQNAEGGWRYKMERGDADISVTVAQVMALRAARNDQAGGRVHQELPESRRRVHVPLAWRAERLPTIGRRHRGPLQCRHL